MTRELRGKVSTGVMVMVFIASLVIFSGHQARAGTYDFGLATSISERYDDNINLQEKRFEEYDFITSYTPHLSLSYLSPGTDARLAYNPSYQMYARHSGENHVRHNGSLNLTSQLTPKLNLSMVDALTYVPGQDTASDEYYTLNQRMLRNTGEDRLTNYYNTTLSYQLLRATTVRGGFGYGFNRYIRSNGVDSDWYRFSFGADHQLTGTDTLFSNYYYRMFRYRDGPVLTPKPDTNVHAINVGETHQFPQQLVLTVAGGPLFIDQDNVGQETSWNAQFTLSKSFQTGGIVFSAYRDASPSYGQGGTTVSNTMNLSATKQFTRRLSGRCSGFYSTQKSPSGNQINDKDWGVILGSSYEFTRRLTGTFGCSYIRQNSTGRAERRPTFGGIDTGKTESYRGRISADYLLRPNWSVFSSYRYYRQNALTRRSRDIDDNIIEVGTSVTWF